MTLDEELARAAQARQITDHPLWIEAFETLSSVYFEQWKNSPARDAEGREALWKLYRTLERVKGHFEEIITTGRLAQAQIDEMNNEDF